MQQLNAWIYPANVQDYVFRFGRAKFITLAINKEPCHFIKTYSQPDYQVHQYIDFGKGCALGIGDLWYGPALMKNKSSFLNGLYPLHYRFVNCLETVLSQ